MSNNALQVKPKIVFFGEGLPKHFFDRISVCCSLSPSSLLGES
jgi:NAD-dependent SIR2 family protein deacetylase